MDKLRKAGDWIWRNKERVFFAIMVLILIVRIYLVFSPPPPRPFPTNVVAASPALSVERQGGVPEPDAPPQQDLVTATTALVDRNPFRAVEGGRPNAREDRVARPNLAVDRVMSIGPSVRVRFANRQGMYEEGEEIDGYTIRRIDASSSSVTIARGSDRFTVTPEGTS